MSAPGQAAPAPLRFVKMHGLGNDFVVVDRRRQDFDPSPAIVRQLADRRTGIGFDQLLLFDEGQGPAEFHWKIFNADGGEVQQCGNGARCVALLAAGGRPARLALESSGGRVLAEVREDGQVAIDMGVPNFDPRALPFDLAAANATSVSGVYTMQAGAQTVAFGAVSVGNPHIVLRVDDVEQAPVEQLGALLETHAAFPERTNVGFVQPLARDRLRLRVWERGAGETLACGTGACAAAAVMRAWDASAECVTVELPGGELTIEWPGDGARLRMTGPATRAYEGSITIL